MQVIEKSSEVNQMTHCLATQLQQIREDICKPVNSLRKWILSSIKSPNKIISTKAEGYSISKS